MTEFIRDSINKESLHSREIREDQPYVGSITPMHDVSGFAKQTAALVAAGTLGKALAAVEKGNLAEAVVGAVVVGAAVGAAASDWGRQFLDYEWNQLLFIGGWHKNASRRTLFKSKGAVLNDLLTRPDGMNSPLFFQFFPETVSDSKAVNFGEISIIGVPNPIPTILSATPRIVSFEAHFARERWNRGKQLIKWDKHNFDVGMSLQVLRSFCYSFAEKVPFPQPLMLNLPGTRIGIDKSNEVAGDSIFCILKNYSATRKSFFPDGTIRTATVSLEFQEFNVVGGGAQKGITTMEDFATVYSDYTKNVTSAIRNTSTGPDSHADTDQVGVTANIDSAGDLTD